MYRRPHSNAFRPLVLRKFAVLGLLACTQAGGLVAQEPEAGEPRPMYIRKYRIKGARQLPSEKVQTAVYPYLGPGRLPKDVDQARAALERAYRDQGYSTVFVTIPMQKIRQGVVTLEVQENPIGRVRVTGARFTSPAAIKRAAPSFVEGKPFNENEARKDIIALNQTRGRQVKPMVRPGIEPGTLDVDLEVEDELPLHGSLELNNRYSVGTTKLRLNGSLFYENLWQLDHTLGASFQIAPENLDDARVFSAYYLAPLPKAHGWSVMLQATRQDSNVSTLGGLAVAGKGEIYGLRAIKPLPRHENFSQSLILGADYKDFDESLSFGGGSIASPVTYYPFSVQYNASHLSGPGHTNFSTGITWSFRGLGSSREEFDSKRSFADGGFIYLRSELSHTRDLTNGYQWFARLQGQASSQPLVNSEQFAGGGLGTVRGYLESEALGDDALFGTFELRSPSLIGGEGDFDNDWRVYAFAEGGVTRIQKPLAGQTRSESLASVGLGTRGRFFGHLNGSLDAALPLLDRPTGLDRKVMYTFRLWGDF